MRNFLCSALTALSILLLTACESNPVPRARTPAADTPWDAAETRSGDAWLAQADAAAGSRALMFYLNAAQAYLNEGQLPAFSAALAKLEHNQSALQRWPRQHNLYGRLRATHHLIREEADLAAAWLATSAVPNPRTNTTEADQYSRLQAAICEQQQDWACAANALMALKDPASYVATPWQQIDHQTPQQAQRKRLQNERQRLQNERQRLNDDIWLQLNRTPRSIAEQQYEIATTAQVRAWWFLRLALAGADSRTERRVILRDWQRRQRAHPASFPWPQALAALLENEARERGHEVAVLLPLSGSFASAGTAVRDGFIAAQLEAEQPVYARFYDVSAEPLAPLLEQLSATTELIIGPLTKERAEELARAQPATPALVLNYLEDQSNTPQTSPLFQLGIVIEDEAETLARQLRNAGHERILVIYGKTAWAERAAARLSESWPGYLRAEPFESVKTITEALGRGMLVDDSHLRSQHIRRTIKGHIEFVPRARKDLDAVVAFVNPVELQALRPALKFHFANRLPLYTTSQAARSNDPKRLAALRGAQLTELPALVRQPPEQAGFTEALALPTSRLADLYALGADALRLAEYLGSQAPDQGFALDGATGALSLQPDGHFRRELDWAIYTRDGPAPAPKINPHKQPIGETGAGSSSQPGRSSASVTITGTSLSVGD